MEKYYSNGKLLLTGEYLVLDGVKSLAVPAKFGQDLLVEKVKEKQIIWQSFTHTGICWFEAIFEMPKLRLLSATFHSDTEGNTDTIAETLLNILQEARKRSLENGSDFLQTDGGFIVKTTLSFPQDWGLGSSSTLINNIASWAKIDAFQLLWDAFSGSGYDIACAQNDAPIFYQLKNKVPVVEKVMFQPDFSDSLFFVHLNKKQNSREGIAQYRKNRQDMQREIEEISRLSEEFIKAGSVKELDRIIVEHERIISSIIRIKSVKETRFPDYFGAIKSLGAWGGDFVLATGNERTPEYFKNKGFKTVIPYTKMVL